MCLHPLLQIVTMLTCWKMKIPVPYPLGWSLSYLKLVQLKTIPTQPYDHTAQTKANAQRWAYLSTLPTLTNWTHFFKYIQISKRISQAVDCSSCLDIACYRKHEKNVKSVVHDQWWIHTSYCKFVPSSKLQHQWPFDKLNPLKQLLDHESHGEILID